MGKRELFLIFGFIVAGALIYQLSTPAAPDAGGGRSWRDVVQEVRTDMFGARARISVERPIDVEVDEDATTLDLGEVNGRVEVIGEARTTVEGVARLTLAGIEGTDEDKRQAEAGLTLSLEPDGDRLVLRVSHTEEWRINRSGRGRPSLDVRLKVPARLGLALNVSGVAEVQGVAAVDLENTRGSITLRRIAGEVTGAQRDGMLEIAGARGVDVEIRRVNLRLEQVDGEVEVEASDGAIEATGLAKKTTLRTRRVGVELTDQSGPLHIEGTDGRAELRGLAAETELDLTRLALQADLAKPVTFTAETADGSVDLRLPDGGLALKVEAQEGSVAVPEGLPAPTRTDATTTLEANWRGGGPQLTLSTIRTPVTLKAP